MTLLEDRVAIIRLALLIEDQSPAERAALLRECRRVEDEAHRQTPFNTYLVDELMCPEWQIWHPRRELDGGLFAVPDDVIRFPKAIVRHLDAADDYETTLGAPDVVLSGVLCAYSEDHGDDCVCRGQGIVRPIRAGQLGLEQGGWLRLAIQVPQPITN